MRTTKKGFEMEVLLLATKSDNIRPNDNTKSNVGTFTMWIEQESGKPHVKFENAPMPGVFYIKTTNVSKDRLVEQFRSIKWNEPEVTLLMIREMGANSVITQESFLLR